MRTRLVCTWSWGFSVLLACLLVGCASYVTPASRQESPASTPEEIRLNFERTAKAAFPARIHVVSVRPNGSMWCADENRDLVSRFLRDAGAKAELRRGSFVPDPTLALNKDGYVVYQSPTSSPFKPTMILSIGLQQSSSDRSLEVGPLGLLTLGTIPTQFVVCDATVSFVLTDAQTGYIYAVGDAGERTIQLHNAWNENQATRDAGRRAVDSAVRKLAVEFSGAWELIVRQYDPDAARVTP